MTENTFATTDRAYQVGFRDALALVLDLWNTYDLRYTDNQLDYRSKLLELIKENL